MKEICQHSTICKEKSRIFQGRKDLIDTIVNYVGKSEDEDNDDSDTPMVIYGESGCGKTSVMAKAAAMAKRKFPDQVQVTRFLGTTSDSSTIFRVLASVCSQLIRTAQLNLDPSKPEVCILFLFLSFFCFIKRFM